VRKGRRSALDVVRREAQPTYAELIAERHPTYAQAVRERYGAPPLGTLAPYRDDVHDQQRKRA